jgi:ferric-dicitrate binding protein FerR (iron transport regulator)
MRRAPTLRIGWFLALATAVCLAPAVTLAVQDHSNIRIVRVSLVEGDVRLSHADANDSQDAALNMPVRHGDLLLTGSGRAEVEFEDGSMIRLAEYSELEFTELALAEGRRITRVTLHSGTASFHAVLARGEIFQVRTPHFDVAASNKSDFRLTVGDADTYVAVHRGDARIETGEGSHRVTRGRALAFGPGTGYQAQTVRAGEDDWDLWVARRHDVVTNAVSSAMRYVNAPVRYGMADLALYGDWVSVSGYGWGWRPRGIGPNWQPFVHGYWGYLHGPGWVWISYEPWGWVPYHYGRWTFVPGYGWLWFQSARWYWHPGLVSWFHFRNRLCWGPDPPAARFACTYYHQSNNGLYGWIEPPAGGETPSGGAPRQPRGIRGVIAKLDPKDEQPRPLDGPPEAPPDIGPRDGRGIGEAAERVVRREGGIVYDPVTGRFINRNNPTSASAPAGEVPSAVPGRAPGDMESPAASPARTSRGIGGAAAPRDARPTEAVRPAAQPRTAPRTEPRPAPQVEPRATPPPRNDPPPRYEPPPRSEPRPAPQVEPRPAPPPTPPPRAEPAPPRPQPQASGLTGASRPRPAAPAASAVRPSAAPRPSASRPSPGASASRPASSGIRGAAQSGRPKTHSRPN